VSGKIQFSREYGKPTDTGYIQLADVKVDDTFRCREQENEEVVESYTETFKKYIKANKRADKKRYEELRNMEHLDYPFPPARIWQDGDDYYLIAGFYRFQAATKTGIERFRVKVFHGTKEEAILFAIRITSTTDYE
jgi:hypothetical protein